jgi:potassium-transporting ATPase potassium-binding subunit
MSANGYLQLVLYVVVLIAAAKPLGAYMARIYEGEPAWINQAGAPFERFIYRLCGVDAEKEMSWVQYAIALLVFNLLGGLVVYGLQRLQAYLPFNPQSFTAVSGDSSFNTAVSFMTNTNWQGYGGESTMSYLTQMAALAVQNFLSAATGMVVVIALIRAFARQSGKTIGNYWVDMTRTTLYILLPLAFVLALVLVSQGVVQTFSAYHTVPLIESVEYDNPKLDAAGTPERGAGAPLGGDATVEVGQEPAVTSGVSRPGTGSHLPEAVGTAPPSAGQPIKDGKGNVVTEKATQKEQVIAVGPAASQIAIKQLGTNGGGFFNANSAHPFENPTPLSNFLEVLAILLIPGALCYTFGRMVGDTRQGWALLAAMTIVLVVMLGICVGSEQRGNPSFDKLGVDQTTTELQSGANMEGKEVRFGIVNSALWATATTAASNGSVNAMHDSFTPIGGLVPMWMMQLGEVIFGGVGSGLYGMLMFVVVAVFVAGLMIGRTPEYLGKKIESFEMKMASIAVLVPLFTALFGTAIAVLVDAGKAGVANPGAHGFSEILYAFSSASGNNGSAFAGLSANTPFYNTALGIVMFFARYWIILPVLALAGSIVTKKKVPAGPGTLPTHNTLFVFWLVGVVVVIGALSFFPALALGPIVEHLALYSAN